MWGSELDKEVTPQAEDKHIYALNHTIACHGLHVCVFVFVFVFVCVCVFISLLLFLSY